MVKNEKFDTELKSSFCIIFFFLFSCRGKIHKRIPGELKTSTSASKDQCLNALSTAAEQWLLRVGKKKGIKAIQRDDEKGFMIEFSEEWGAIHRPGTGADSDDESSISSMFQDAEIVLENASRNDALIESNLDLELVGYSYVLDDNASLYIDGKQVSKIEVKFSKYDDAITVHFVNKSNGIDEGRESSYWENNKDTHLDLSDPKNWEYLEETNDIGQVTSDHEIVVDFDGFGVLVPI